MRLIDADALINTLQELFDKREKEARFTGDRGVTVTWNDAIYHIKIAPTIEERKTGKWVIKTVNTFELAYGSTGYEPVYECSVCGGVEESYLRLDEPIMPDDADFPNYCPNCGADMRETP